MAPQEFSATIVRGADFCFGMVFGETVDYASIQSPDAYVDMTDWVFDIKLYTSAGVLITPMTTELVTPWVLNISLTAAQTQALSAQFGARMSVFTTRPNESRREQLIVGRVTIQNP